MRRLAREEGNFCGFLWRSVAACCNGKTGETRVGCHYLCRGDRYLSSGIYARVS